MKTKATSKFIAKILAIEDIMEDKFVDCELAIERFITAPRKPVKMSEETKTKLLNEWAENRED